MTWFELLKAILLKSNTKEYYLEHPDFESVMSPFMLARYLSMTPKTLKWGRAVNHLNKAKLSNRHIFLFAWENIPKQTSGYIPYMKKEKKKK